MKIKFFNKVVDAINLPALLQSASVTDKSSVHLKDKEPQLYHMNTLAPFLASFSDSLSNPQSCQCKESKFCFQLHGHVIVTGDLNVIENAIMGDLLAKGPKYREPNRVNW